MQADDTSCARGWSARPTGATVGVVESLLTPSVRPLAGVSGSLGIGSKPSVRVRSVRREPPDQGFCSGHIVAC